MSLFLLGFGLFLGAVYWIALAIESRNEKRREAHDKAWQVQRVPKARRPLQTFPQPPTREEMIEEIITEWGVAGDHLGIGDIVYLNNGGDDAWSSLWAAQQREEDEKCKAWLQNASADWLPAVEDLITNPPDFAALTVCYPEELDDCWPYLKLEEETWLYQIDGMLSIWEEREPIRVRPLLELVRRKLSKYVSG